MGYGVIGPGIRIEQSLPEQCSVFTAEAAALAHAAHRAKTRSVIFSDSASSLQALESGKSRNSYIQKIEKVIEDKDLRFCWIPGHSRIPGNEEADSAANCGRHKPVGEEDVPAQDIKVWVTREIWRAHQSAWDQAPRNNLKIVKPNVGRWIDRSNRKEQIVLTRLRIGHAWFTKRYLFEKNPREKCTLCDRYLSVHHVLASCQSYNAARRELGISNELRRILQNEKTTETKLISFTKKIGIFKCI